MGLNLVIGCHICRERLWLWRGENDPIFTFYKAHWPDDRRERHDVELSDDQAEAEWVSEYAENPARYGRRL